MFIASLIVDIYRCSSHLSNVNKIFTATEKFFSVRAGKIFRSVTMHEQNRVTVKPFDQWKYLDLWAANLRILSTLQEV